MSGRGMGRVGDRAVGPKLRDVAVAGSANVLVNGIAALRHGDHGAQWVAAGGAAHVLVNGKLAFRVADATASRTGKLVKGSPNVLVGDAGIGGKVGAFVAPKGKVALSELEARPKKSGWFKRALAAVWKGVKRVAKALVLAGVAAKALGGTAWKLVKDVLKWAAYVVTAGLQWLVLGAWRFPKYGECPPSNPEPVLTHAAELPPKFVDAAPKSDVTAYLSDVVDAFAPEIYQDPEDVHPISMAQLLGSSTVRTADGTAVQGGVHPGIDDYHALLFGTGPAYGKSPYDAEKGPKPPFYLDIDDEVSKKRGGEGGVVYGRARKITKSVAVLEYRMIRAGSYLPWPADPYAFWEHEGDGEGCEIYVKHENEAWRLMAVQYSAHGQDSKCCCACTAQKADGKVKVYVARGSHAVAPTPERRTSRGIGIDTFDDEHLLSYSLLRKPSISAKEHEVVFTNRSIWGTPSAFKPDGPMVGAHSYAGYGEWAEATVPKWIVRDMDEKEDELPCNPEC